MIRGIRLRSLLLFSLILGTSSAQAYIDYAPNDHLAEEVADHSYRILPHNEHYSLAIDGDFFKPVFVGSNNFNYYKYDFYHGNGYWVDTRVEFKPVEDLIVNMKFDVTQGTSSNGPTLDALIVPHVALTYRWHLLGFDWAARLSDIERQTIGTGLFIEFKETEGGWITAKRDSFEAKMMVDGTGSFRVEGGLIAFDVSFWDHLLGGTFFIQETDNSFSPPQYMGTVYSKRDWSNGLGYGLEYGGDSAAPAMIAYAQYKGSFGNFNVFLKPQFRHYGHGVLGTLPGNVQQNYVSYDQNDKPYTTLMDIFVYGDDVNTFSGQLNVEYVFNSFYRVYAETEALRYEYQKVPTLQAFFYRTGFKFYPFKNRDDEFGVLVGNKYLIASTAVDASGQVRTYSSPLANDFENKPLFLQQTFIMANFSAKF